MLDVPQKIDSGAHLLSDKTLRLVTDALAKHLLILLAHTQTRTAVVRKVDHVFVVVLVELLMTYPEAEGFWVRGRQDTQFVLVPDPSSGAATVRLLVRNGASPNQVSVESGTFQRLLVMTPGQEQELEIPLGPGGSASVRVASGDGFVPAERDPASSDRRLLGVWLQLR